MLAMVLRLSVISLGLDCLDLGQMFRCSLLCLLVAIALKQRKLAVKVCSHW